MKLEFMDMYFDENGKTYWSIWNKKKEKLGIIRYWKPWKKYVWDQDNDIIMSKDCLKQIADFLEDL